MPDPNNFGAATDECANERKASTEAEGLAASEFDSLTRLKMSNENEAAAPKPDDDLDVISVVADFLRQEKPDRELFVEHALFIAIVTDETGTYIAHRSDDNIAQWTELGMLHTSIVTVGETVLENIREILE